MLSKLSVSSSLCSRTVKFTIFNVIFGHAIESSSKYFTQINCLVMSLRKNNNVAKVVSLKQNNSEGFIGTT